MKNVTLFACLLVLTLGAAAQTSRTVRPIAIPPNAHNGAQSNSNGTTTINHAAGQSAEAKSAISGGPQGPPVVKPPIVVAPPNAVHVPPTARK